MAECLEWVEDVCIKWSKDSKGKNVADLSTCDIKTVEKARKFAHEGLRFKA